MSTTFGLRDLHAEGNQFILNGHPMYFRGTHFGGDFPLTGYPPTDVASWKKIFQTCKDYGLNHMRFHSWCPPEAAFEAADELGFYLQIECGMWNEFSPGGQMEKQLYSETERILRRFRQSSLAHARFGEQRSARQLETRFDAMGETFSRRRPAPSLHAEHRLGID